MFATSNNFSPTFNHLFNIWGFTLHDTVATIYQDLSEDKPSNINTNNQSETCQNNPPNFRKTDGRLKRSYSSDEFQIFRNAKERRPEFYKQQ